MMRNLRFVLFVFLILLLGLFVSSSFAGSAIVHGEFTVDSPLWHRPNGPGDLSGDYWEQSSCSQGVTDYSSYYETFSFSVSVDGSYTIEMLSYDEAESDANFTLYSSRVPFNSTGAGPCVAFNDDRSDSNYMPLLHLDLEAGITYTLVVSPYDGHEPDDLGAFSIEFSGAGDIIFGTYFVDGRLNNRDGAAPVVVYIQEAGISIYSDAGVQILFVTIEELEAVGDCPSTNTLIASTSAVAVYRLSSCEFQINAPMYNGKLYVMIFSSLDASDYISYEIE